MIITLQGTVIAKGGTHLVVEVAGIGYQVFVNPAFLARLETGQEIRLWTHEYLREDARELYGFDSAAEHGLFRRLLDVSGVGPKMAVHILSLGPVGEIEKRIEQGDADWISTVPGVGKKTAQKIILELKGKLVGVDDVKGPDVEVLEALRGMGYSSEQARRALSAAPKGDKVEERLRAALRELAR
ncbi:hypothetical protein AMJ57_03110 [Parcubacteria bacterium SG8_24]|nr:MAG: hypothetical protein AMJ57_03110 [Parcubacteria bacterium SG8_24]